MVEVLAGPSCIPVLGGSPSSAARDIPELPSDEIATDASTPDIE